jgi:hypothetical protein
LVRAGSGFEGEQKALLKKIERKIKIQSIAAGASEMRFAARS